MNTYPYTPSDAYIPTSKQKRLGDDVADVVISPPPKIPSPLKKFLSFSSPSPHIIFASHFSPLTNTHPSPIMANLTIPSGTMLGFAANQTEAQAKANAAAIQNRLTICQTKQLYVNGQRVGLTEGEQSALTALNLQNATSAVSLSLVSSPQPFELHGFNNDQMQYPTTAAVTLTVKYGGTAVQAVNASGTAQSTVQIKTSDAAKIITLTWDASSKTYKGTNAKSAGEQGQYGTFSAAIQVCATSHGSVVTSPKTVSLTITPADYVYYGISSKAALTAADILAFSKHSASAAAAANVIALSGSETLAPTSTLKTSAAGTYPFTFKAGTYAYILIPTWMNKGKFQTETTEGSSKIVHCSEGVADVIFCRLTDLATSGLTVAEAADLKKMAQTFAVYRIQNTQAAGSHTFNL